MKIKSVFTSILLFIISGKAIAQDNSLPDWFLDEMAAEVGTWVADNSKYMSEDESMEAYALEWNYGPLKNNIYGRLYGIIDGKDVGTYWEFHKYYDPQQQKVVVTQIGWNGTLGYGSRTKAKEKMTELVQIFTSPNGIQRKEGHRTTKTNSSEKIGTSFQINDKNEWILRRSYTWKKIQPEEIPKEENLDIEKISFLIGRWKTIAPDSSFSSELEYKYSPNHRYMMATNHLYNSDGNLIGIYEGGYMVKDETLIYFLSGPQGEFHEGTAMVDGSSIIHQAKIYPGKQVKSYMSKMMKKEDHLYYYATYSTAEQIPKKIDNNSPLIYQKLN